MYYSEKSIKVLINKKEFISQLSGVKYPTTNYTHLTK